MNLEHNYVDQRMYRRKDIENILNIDKKFDKNKL